MNLTEPSLLEDNTGSRRAKRQRRIRAHSTPGQVAEAATNNAGLTAHRLPAACPPLCFPGAAPVPGHRSCPRQRTNPIAAVSSPDNGSCYRGVVHALACKALGIKHLRTRPYRPRTNGKAERFIRTMLGGWAYGAIYGNSDERRAALPGWLDFYNRRRPHGSLSHQPPLQRLEALTRNNLAGNYS